MTQKHCYQQPEANGITLYLEGSLLDGSTLKTISLTEGTTTGERVYYDSEVNPW